MSSFIEIAIVRRERNDNNNVEEPDDHRAWGIEKDSGI
jgi:hypothetical protein